MAEKEAKRARVDWTPWAGRGGGVAARAARCAWCGAVDPDLSDRRRAKCDECRRNRSCADCGLRFKGTEMAGGGGRCVGCALAREPAGFWDLDRAMPDCGDYSMVSALHMEPSSSS